jgi:hypothetical protein
VTPRAANALTALALVGFAAGISATAPRWARYLRQPIPAAEDEAAAGPAEASPAQAEAGASRSEAAERTISVKLFFEAADRRGLVPEERTVPFRPELSEQIRVVAEELIRGSRQGLLAPLHPETRVLDVFLTARGVAYLDLSQQASLGQAGGAEAELHSVYAIVDSIIENFPAVRRVQILIEDRPAETLAGHVDLSRPLAADLTLLAPAPMVEVPRPEATPPEAPPPAAPSAGPPPARGAAASSAPGPRVGIP